MRIDFDDRPAPSCAFSGAERIADQWAPQGVTFSAPAPFQTGAIQDRDACFATVSGHSAPNIAAWVAGLADLPLVMDFDPPVVSVGILATNWRGVDSITLTCFDDLGTEVGNDSISTIGMVGPLQPLEVAGAGIVRAEITNDSFNDDVAFDDLVFVQAPLQACCFEDVLCEDLTPDDCAVQGGTAQGVGSDCASVRCEAVPGMPGEVPDGARRPGLPLRVARSSQPEEVDLSWSLSCSPEATDYTVHEGAIGEWYGHQAVFCDSGGRLTSATVASAPGGRYFLVVPVTPSEEGSYGLDSMGLPRPPSAPPSCRAVQVVGCP